MSDVSMPGRKTHPSRVAITPDGRILVRIDEAPEGGSLHAALDYTLAADLTPLSVGSSDTFKIVRDDMLRAGRVKGPMDEAYFAALLARVRVHDGIGWLVPARR